MLILALDPATNTGWCRGTTDVVPKSGSCHLRPDPKEDVSVVPYNMMALLKDLSTYGLPDLLVYEAPLSMASLKNFDRPQNEETAKMPYYLESAIYIWCTAKNVPFKAVQSATTRAHFLGSGWRRGIDKSLSKDKQRTERKKLILARAKILGYIDKNRLPTRADASDSIYDVADACSIWDYAAATWGNRIERELHMYGEKAAS